MAGQQNFYHGGLPSAERSGSSRECMIMQDVLDLQHSHMIVMTAGRLHIWCATSKLVASVFSYAYRAVYQFLASFENNFNFAEKMFTFTNLLYGTTYSE